MNSAVETQVEIGSKVKNGVALSTEVSDWCKQTIDLLKKYLDKIKNYPGVEQP